MTRYRLFLQPSAIEDLDRLRRFDAARIADRMEKYLGEDPTRESKSRIKRLRGISDPDFRLRIDDYRVFYNVHPEEKTVRILRIMNKKETGKYYQERER